MLKLSDEQLLAVLMLHEHSIFCSLKINIRYFDVFFFFQKIEAQAIEEFYGLTSEIQKASESGYILFYEARG